jgi:hypothetical protein
VTAEVTAEEHEEQEGRGGTEPATAVSGDEDVGARGSDSDDVEPPDDDEQRERDQEVLACAPPTGLTALCSAAWNDHVEAVPGDGLRLTNLANDRLRRHRAIECAAAGT